MTAIQDVPTDCDGHGVCTKKGCINPTMPNRLLCVVCACKKEDPVNHPAHYKQGKHEVIDITEDHMFNIGNVLKYVLRAEHKGKHEEDLRKAAWYLDREIQRLFP